MIDLFSIQNNIPVFSPALTDGSLGDMIYFHSYKNPGLIIDIVEGNSRSPPLLFLPPHSILTSPPFREFYRLHPIDMNILFSGTGRMRYTDSIVC